MFSILNYNHYSYINHNKRYLTVQLGILYIYVEVKNENQD
jgi:hypothetical protein